MGVTLNAVTLSVREIERGIMTESKKCVAENWDVQNYGSVTTDLVMLHTNALAKKWLGIYGVSIGNDPRRFAKLGIAEVKRDWEAEKTFYRQLHGSDKDTADRECAILDQQRECAERIDAEFDGDAWRALIEVESWINRRCVALDELGLISFNGSESGLPDDFVKDEGSRPDGAAEIPWEGTVVLTDKGHQFMMRNGILRPRKNQPAWARHRLDELLEIVY